MKFLQKTFLAIALCIFLAACQSGADRKQLLAAADSRKEIMDTIANDGNMSKEMMQSMMNSENSKIMIEGNEVLTSKMMKNHTAMIKMMKDNPHMMESMLADMLETCKSDTAMMSLMYRTMMGNTQMRELMHKNMGKMK